MAWYWVRSTGYSNSLLRGLFYALAFGYLLGDLDSNNRVWKWFQRRRVWGVLAGICWGLLPGLAYSPYLPRIVPVDGLTRDWGARLVLRPACGLAIALAPDIQQRVVNWQLRRIAVVPPHLSRFLDYAADRTLLQRVGGGYRFIHTLLRDYFADLGAEELGCQGQFVNRRAPAVARA